MIPVEHLVICECLDTGYTIETNRDTRVSEEGLRTQWCLHRCGQVSKEDGTDI